MSWRGVSPALLCIGLRKTFFTAIIVQGGWCGWLARLVLSFERTSITICSVRNILRRGRELAACFALHDTYHAPTFGKDQRIVEPNELALP